MTQSLTKLDRIDNLIDFFNYVKVITLRDQLNQAITDIESNNGDVNSAYITYDNYDEYSGISNISVVFDRPETPIELEQRLALEKQNKEAKKKLAREQKKKREEQEIDAFKNLWKKYNGKVAME
jgi:hypothetical protein